MGANLIAGIDPRDYSESHPQWRKQVGCFFGNVESESPRIFHSLQHVSRTLLILGIGSNARGRGHSLEGFLSSSLLFLLRIISLIRLPILAMFTSRWIRRWTQWRGRRGGEGRGERRAAWKSLHAFQISTKPQEGTLGPDNNRPYGTRQFLKPTPAGGYINAYFSP